MNKIQIFDTTLRDGAQTAGVNMTPEKKIAIAKKLDDFGVDMIEAGFSASSVGDTEAIREISRIVNARVFSLARLNENDINSSYDSLQDSKNRGIHTFIGTSPMHRDFKLKMTQEQILTHIHEKVAFARAKFNHDTDMIMFSPEDALRTEKDFLFESIYAAVKSGANIINIPDTVGFAQPGEIGELFNEFTWEFPHIDFSAHMHNDLGNAVANSLSAIKNGGSIIQGTIPPAYGERAGNADLIQVLMNIIKRPDIYDFELNPGLDMKKTSGLVQFISNNIGKRISDNHPVTGGDVFRHSSGIHQDGASKNKSTYEIISPEEIGYQIEQSFVLTNQSGRAGLKNAISVYFGLELDDAKLNEVFDKFKLISTDTGKSFITIDDIRNIIISSGVELNRNITVDNYFINLDNNNSSASIELKVNGEIRTCMAKGVGPVDSIYNAIIKATNMTDINLIDFSISALSSSPSSEAKVSIKIEHDGNVYEEYGLDKDIVKASIIAFVNCLDRIKND
ncbi:MAG: 2-isopropylmalate synthase [Candidatus Gracilibacteria bacterium]|nr:2-isopropylmalate synthase [Candidatus Gracilibacteria bacterium]